MGLAMETSTAKSGNEWSGIDDGGSSPRVVGLLTPVFFLLVSGGVAIGACAVAALFGWH
jgi:hypothetical protein